MIISYAQNFEDVMLWRALHHVKKGFYIDVGANDPVIDSVTQLFYENNWHGINIEPLASHWQALQRTRLRDINLQCAAGEFDGEINLWECDVHGWATADAEVIELHVSNGHAGHYISIPQITLNRIWAQHAPTEVHFLKIDVEGLEFSVLKGLDFQRFRPWIVVVEATRPTTTQEVHAQWEPLLLGSDYLFVYADGINRFYVACEHLELVPAFKYPPNCFDHFLKAPNIADSVWAKAIESRATQSEARATMALAELADAHARVESLLKLTDAAEARATQSDARASALLAHVAYADARIESFLSSTSWRLTAPLRMVSSGLSGLSGLSRLSGLTRSLQTRKFPNVAASIVRYAASHLILREIGLRVLAGFPATKSRIKKLMRSAPATSVGPHAVPAPAHLAHLAPRVRTLYAALRREWAHPAVPMVAEQAQTPARRLRLAYVSPLPPVRSGISDYSANLLPALARFYDIDVILEQATLSDDWIKGHCGVRDSQWLLQNPAHYDRVLYHFGNSSYHQHMFHLLAQVPGMVVLHDFYLGDVLNHFEAYAIDAFALQRGLYKSHGYGALLRRSKPGWLANVLELYPASFEVLQLAHGVIVHSQHAKQLAARWYGANAANNCFVIPMLRQPNNNADRTAARQAMGIQAGEFVVCSFGFMGPAKLNQRLLLAWVNSAIARDQNCRLVFVGEARSEEYGEQIKRAIQTSGLQHRIHISGWNDSASYARYLMAADLAVQLRTNSRGETSAAVLDCMNYGLPTIVNACGAFAELPPDAVCMLPEDFHDAQLTEAINTLWLDHQRRNAIGTQGKNYIQNQRAPDLCAEQYAQAIELTHSRTTSQAQAVRQALVTSMGLSPQKPILSKWHKRWLAKYSLPPQAANF